MVTFCKFVHPAKAFSFKTPNCLGRLISVRAEQFAKACLSIMQVESSNSTSERFLQSRKVYLNILSILGNLTFFKFVPSSADSPR